MQKPALSQRSLLNFQQTLYAFDCSLCLESPLMWWNWLAPPCKSQLCTSHWKLCWLYRCHEMGALVGVFKQHGEWLMLQIKALFHWRVSCYIFPSIPLASICPLCFRSFVQLSVLFLFPCFKGTTKILTKSVNAPPSLGIFKAPQVLISMTGPGLETSKSYMIPNHIHFISHSSTIIIYPASQQNLFNIF